MEEKKLDLRSVRAPAGTVTLNDGKDYPVLHTNGRQQHELRTMPREEATTRVYAIAKELVPTAPPEQIDDLDLKQLDALLVMAGAGIEAVEKLYPNAVSPAASTSPG